MDHNRFLKISRDLYAALEALGERIPPKDRGDIIEFIEVNEYGVALETLCAVIAEERVRIDDSEWQQLLDLADAMGMRSTTTDLLQK